MPTGSLFSFDQPMSQMLSPVFALSANGKKPLRKEARRRPAGMCGGSASDLGNNVAGRRGHAGDGDLRDVVVAYVALVARDGPEVVRDDNPHLNKVHGQVFHAGA